METIILAMSFLASVLMWVALRKLVREHQPYVVLLAYWIHGIRPLARRNTYRSLRKNTFLSAREVREAETQVQIYMEHLGIPLVSVVPLIVGISACL